MSSDVTWSSRAPSSPSCSALGLAAEADRLAADPPGDDVFEADERAAADEQDVRRVHLDVLLLGMLAAALRRDVGDGAFEHLQQGLLHAFAGDVAGDRDVVVRLADLVDFVDVDDAALGRFEVEVGGVQELEQDVLDVLADVAGLGERGGVADGEGDVEDAGQGLGQQRLAAAGRADQEDVRLVELDVAVALLAVDEPLVVVVDGDGEDLLGAVLADDVLVELFLDLARGGDVGEEGLGDAPAAAFLVEDRLAELDALAADVDVAGPFDERADVAVALAAERAVGVLLDPAGGRAGRSSRRRPRACRRRAAAARDVLTRWHAWSFRPSTRRRRRASGRSSVLDREIRSAGLLTEGRSSPRIPGRRLGLVPPNPPAARRARALPARRAGTSTRRSGPPLRSTRG